MRDAPTPITLFCLHFLAGSRHSWTELMTALGDAVEPVPIDLPGFGDNAGHRGHAVAAMADHVALAIANRRPARYALAGHSLGAKVAAVLARRAEDGEPALAGLVGVVLLAGSPPGPEPIPDDRRATMLGWFESADAERHRAQADEYVGANVGAALPPAVHGRTVADVLRSGRTAWRAWLNDGSREDWSAFVGVLTVPALIAAGEADADLGPDAQRSLVAPHFARHRFAVLPGAGHLLPLERPDAVAELIGAFLADPPPDTSPSGTSPPEPALTDRFVALLRSDRVSGATRDVLHARLAPPPSRSVLTPPLHAVLRAVVDAVLPQERDRAVDLAGRIDAGLAAGEGDGWRFDDLPDDAVAMRAGLATFDRAARARHGAPAVTLDREARAELFAAALGGALDDGGSDAAMLDAARMAHWAEDLRALAVRHFVSHPATLARMGYSGAFYAGDDPTSGGFTAIGPGERDGWEPVASADAGAGR